MRKYVKRLLLLFGAAMIIAGLGLGVWWHYWLRPVRVLYDSRWSLLHDDLARLEQYEKCIRRDIYFHDKGWVYKEYGDKAWVECFMAQLEPGDEVRSCTAGHVDIGLKALTNQHPGDKAVDWLQWWDRNWDKTQEQWIRDGFEKFGVELAEPLSAQNIRSLLVLIEQNRQDRETTPDHLAWNARRRLCEEEFDAQQFLTDHPDIASDEILVRGLIGYAQSERRMRELQYIAEGFDYPTARMNTPRWKAMINVTIFLLIALGVGVCRYVSKR